MVRIPASWRKSLAAYPAGSGRGGQVAARRVPIVPIGAYTTTVTVPLGSYGQAPVATFTAGGTAQAQVGPSGVGETWSLDQCNVSTSKGVLDPAQATIYAGPLPIPTLAVAPAFAGGGNQLGLGGIGLQTGEYIFARWTGGTPGAQAYLNVTGQKTVLSQ
jgi:hypothetical protein